MYKKSWRVQVNYCDKERVLDPQNWPAGWGVRQYFRARSGPGYKPIQQGVPFDVPKNGDNKNVADKVAAVHTSPSQQEEGVSR